MRKLMLSAMTIAILGTSMSFAAPFRRERYDSEVSLTVGYFEPRGESELWRQNERDFTLSAEDLGDVVVGARVGSIMNNFVAFDVGISYYDKDTTSQYRFFVDQFGDPIEQNERLRLLPVDMTVKIMPFGRFAEYDHRHRAQRVVPYIGFGGGALLWRYREKGDFVDGSTGTVFASKFRSRGIAPEYHGVVGVDVTLNRQAALYVEAKVMRARDSLSSDFQGFDKLDLSGDTIAVGTRIRF